MGRYDREGADVASVRNTWKALFDSGNATRNYRPERQVFVDLRSSYMRLLFDVYLANAEISSIDRKSERCMKVDISLATNGNGCKMRSGEKPLNLSPRYCEKQKI